MGRVYRPAFGQNPTEGGGMPYEIVNEGSETGIDAGPDDAAASAAAAASADGGQIVTETQDSGQDVSIPADGGSTPVSETVTPTGTKEALERQLREARADAKKWRMRFIVATVVGSVATAGGVTAGFFIGHGRGRKAAMRGYEDAGDVGDDGMGDDG